MDVHIKTPLTRKKTAWLKCGDMVYLTGTISTARDAAHKRLIELLEAGKQLPFDIKDQIIYYVGPTPAKENQIIGSAGPTTSYRMDSYAPKLLDLGLKGMIGKGKRNADVIDTIRQNGAVYFGAIGGAGALLSKCITKSEIVAYEDLQSEAIRRLEVVDMPLFVIIDSHGNNLYDSGPEEYLGAQMNEPDAESQETVDETPFIHGEVYKLETNIDDCTGEMLGYVMELLFKAGACDVNYTPVYMKKNRPAYELHVICCKEDISEMELIIFHHTTTIGIRNVRMDCTVLKRNLCRISTSLGEAVVKVCRLPGTDSFVDRVYPEYTSVISLCEEHGLAYQEVYQRIIAEYRAETAIVISS